MYLEHFALQEFPFVLTPNTQYFCNLPSYQEALNVLLVSLRSGEGFIKIVGEVGVGKTLLCRELLNKLDDNYVTAYIANPALDCLGFYKALAHELNIDFPKDIDQYGLLDLINDKLLMLHKRNQRVVVIIDEAQVLPDQSLEGLRLLSNLETESAKLLQIVLFGQPELDTRLRQPNLRQLKQRIAFAYQLRALNFAELEAYVHYRLSKAGSNFLTLFSTPAYKKLFQASRGIPRLINVLCHKALIAAYGRGLNKVDSKSMHMAIKDTESVFQPQKNSKLVYVLFLFLLGIMAFEIWSILGGYL
ncbi:MAG: AAA family ATPase [Gammaproteobacteria bacterium]|nr:AAA family ATPase [Gammaproteobacteria bacterium]